MLQLADNLALPLEAVTSAFGVLGQRGSGKTSTAVVLAEEMVRAGIQIAVVDPLDAWFGLRSNAAGDGPGLPVVVFGGDHGDLPLDVGMAATLADVAVDDQVPMVLSLRHLSKGDQRRFVAAWSERLYHRKGAAQHRQPLHVIIDEADAFTPQAVRGDVARVMGAVDDLVRRGRSSGFGITLITQRAAAINKDVLSQIDTLIAMRTVSPQDRKALESWIEAHDTAGRRHEFLASLSSLEVGEAWVWSPGWLDLFERVRIRPRQTFDSSATPKVGQRVAAPTAFAAVDLEQLRGRLEQAVERAAADDPKVLRARIVQLERQLKAAAAAPVIERVEVSVLTERDWMQLNATLETFTVAASSVLAMGRELRETVGAVMAERTPPAVRPVEIATVRRPSLDTAPLPSVPSTRRIVPVAVPAGDGPRLRAGERKMLAVLAQHPAGLTRQQLATLSRFSVKGGTFGAYLGVLKREGLADDDGARLTLTARGRENLGLGGDGLVPPATTEEVLAIWRAELRAGERAMLDCLVQAYPGALSKAELAEITGFTASGGTFSAYLGVLRRNGLIEVNGGEVSASATLFLGGR